MGRIKTKRVKRVTHKIFKLHQSDFCSDYDMNKVAVNKLISTDSKKLRNIVTGYVTRLAKEGKEPKKRVSKPLPEDIKPRRRR